MHRKSRDVSLADRSGQSMVELLVVLPVILLLLLGTIQLALILHAKITLNYAVFEAARAGTLGNAQFTEVREGLARGLAPLYSYAGEDGDQVAAFQRARQVVFDLFEDQAALVRVERLNPTDGDFQRYGASGEIANDNLLYRSSAFREPATMSIQDANLLHLRVVYWYPLYVPFINSMIHDFVCCGEDEECRWQGDPACLDDQPRIPLTAVAALRMQTPAKTSEGYYSSSE